MKTQNYEPGVNPNQVKKVKSADNHAIKPTQPSWAAANAKRKAVKEAIAKAIQADANQKAKRALYAATNVVPNEVPTLIFRVANVDIKFDIDIQTVNDILDLI